MSRAELVPDRASKLKERREMTDNQFSAKRLAVRLKNVPVPAIREQRGK